LADPSVFDVYGLEDGIVEATAHGRTCLRVCGMAVPGEPDRGTEHVLPALQVALGALEFPLGRLLDRADPVLFVLQQLAAGSRSRRRPASACSFFGEPGERLREDDAPL
jgi:hypothetical protein